MQTGQPQAPSPTPPSAGTPRRKAFRAKLRTVGDCSTQLARLFREARGGEIDVQDASRLANILSILSRIISESELEARIAALEAKGGK